jgi:hypothetical protein
MVIRRVTSTTSRRREEPGAGTQGGTAAVKPLARLTAARGALDRIAVQPRRWVAPGHWLAMTTGEPKG